MEFNLTSCNEPVTVRVGGKVIEGIADMSDSTVSWAYNFVLSHTEALNSVEEIAKRDQEKANRIIADITREFLLVVMGEEWYDAVREAACGSKPAWEANSVFVALYAGIFEKMADKLPQRVQKRVQDYLA